MAAPVAVRRVTSSAPRPMLSALQRQAPSPVGAHAPKAKDHPMSTHEDETVKDAVRTRYAVSAVTKTSCCGPGSSCCSPAQAGAPLAASLYDPAALAALPDGADLGLGCGDPLAMESLKPGEIVVDLGSGGGVDCFLAARRVGPTGRVIGVDMTPEMVGLAWDNASRGGIANVEFVLGEIESLPVDDATADIVISNCVINLVPDKRRAFAEAFRVTKPGGRLSVSDIVTTGPLPAPARASMAAYTACIGGARGERSRLPHGRRRCRGPCRRVRRRASLRHERPRVPPGGGPLPQRDGACGQAGVSPACTGRPILTPRSRSPRAARALRRRVPSLSRARGGPGTRRGPRGRRTPSR